MFDFLGAPEILPFTVALALMLMIGLVEALGLGASAVHLDADLDLHGDHLLGWWASAPFPCSSCLSSSWRCSASSG